MTRSETLRAISDMTTYFDTNWMKNFINKKY